jgi:hypothetical protein
MLRRSRPVLFASAVYLFLTTVLTWPLLAHLGSLVPNDLGDPLLNMWLLAWNARTIPLTAHWWNAPQFVPVTGVMAFSEHLLGLSVITTPVIWATGNTLLAYNLAFFLSFPLSALAAYFLGYTIARRHDVAFIAGLAFAFAPYRMAQFAHVQVMSSYWMPLALAALHRYFDHRRSRWLFVFALAWVMQALACGYYLIYLSVLVGFWLIWFAAGRERWGDVGRVAIAWTAGAVLLAPVLYGYWQFQHAYGFRRSIFEIKLFSADVASLLKAPDTLLVWGWLNVIDRPEAALFPGLTVVIITGAALVLGWRAAGRQAISRRPIAAGLLLLAIVFTAIAISPAFAGPWKLEIAGIRLLSVTKAYKPLSIAALCAAIACVLHPSVRMAWRRRSALAFYAFAAVLMWVMSLGPEPTLMNSPFLYKAPYAWLMELPGVEGVRVPARFWMLAILCLSVAAGLAVRYLSGRWPSLAKALPLLACIGIVLDGWPGRATFVAPPDPRPSHTRAEARLDLPTDATQDLLALYRSIEHRVPLINGYSGYFARHYWVLQYLIDHQDPHVLPWLASKGTLEVVVDHALDPDGGWRKFAASQPGAERVYADSQYSDYRIPAASSPSISERIKGEPLSIAAIVADERAERVAAMTDHDIMTRWHVGRPQARGDTMTVDVGQPRAISGVELLIGGYVADFPRQLRIELSIDGQNWTETWSGPTALLALGAALDDPLASALPFAFEPRTARYVRLTEMAADPTYYWSVAELRVYGK